ncbi:hypothetical protein BN3662_00239 [Clostridiales bacterium CHKCI006]|nr:hypothetical protein BN3662_00239 [Clostridiales bacterium CHKCI006]
MIEKEIPMLADHLYGEEFLLCELKAISFEWFQRCVFNYVNLLNVDNRTCGIMKLLTTLDNAMHGIIERMIMSQQYVVKEVTALNSNYSETGIALLPYVKCAWQRGARSSQHGFSINHCMNNLYYVPLSSLRIRGGSTKLDVVHVFAYRNMFFEAYEKRKLKISISPVTKHEILKDINYSSDKNGNHFFEINEIMNQSEIGRCVLADTLVACQRESDILVFPELLGFEELNKKMQYLLGVTLIGNNLRL